jgi:hypothetical protein
MLFLKYKNRRSSYASQYFSIIGFLKGSSWNLHATLQTWVVRSQRSTVSSLVNRGLTLWQLPSGIFNWNYPLETLTCVDLVKEYYRSILSYNGYLNAIYELAPSAFEQAEKLDEMREQGQILGHLHGIPVLLKVCKSRHFHGILNNW